MRIGVGSDTLLGGRGRPRDWKRPWATVVMPTPNVAASSKEILSLILAMQACLTLTCSAKAPLDLSFGSAGKD
jgi:hypothetical protein